VLAGELARAIAASPLADADLLPLMDIVLNGIRGDVVAQRRERTH